MSAIFDATTEAATRTTAVVNGNSDYACTFWLKSVGTPAAIRCAYVTKNAGYTAFVRIVNNSGLDTWKLQADNGGSLSSSTATTLTPGTWYKIAYVRTAGVNKFYVNGVLIGSVSKSMAAVTFADVSIGDDGASETGMEIAFFREWSNDTNFPTATELNLEWNARQATFLTDLVCDIPLESDALDISGNGNDLTEVGTLTYDAANPAVIANGNAETALTIGPFPDTATQSLNGSGYAFDAWYKWTAEADGLAGIYGRGDAFASILIRTFVYTGTPSALTLLMQTLSSTLARNRNVPIQFAATMGTDYFFRFSPQNATVASATLDVDVQFLAVEAAPIGSIVVNNDANGLPLIIVSAADSDDHHTLNYLAVAPDGEAGDVIDTGSFILHDQGLDQLEIFDNQFVQQVVIPSIDLSSIVGALRTCLGTQRWWIAYTSGVTKRVRSVDEDGTLGTEHTLTSITDLSAIAASNDEEILYWTGGSPGNRAIKRWDLLLDVALSDLVAEVSGYVTADILVLGDDTIIYSLIDSTGTPDVQVRHVAADGTALNTYNFGSSFVFPGGGTLPRLAYAIDDPTSFWFWTHPELGTNDGLSRFQEVQVSDGTILTEVDHAEFESNIYTPDSSDPPLARFGNPFSCPFFITRAVFPEIVGTGTIIVRKVTLPEGDVTEFDFNAGGGLSPATFSLSDGETETYLDVPVGDGYSIEEDPVAGYSTTYDVSNDSPVDDISVADGEIVTVTVTNSLLGSITVIKVVVPSGPEDFDFETVNLTPSTFSLGDLDEQLFDDVAAGDGYEVVETPVPDGWTVGYDVSNGSPNTNITVAPGEDVIVTVINSTGGGGLFTIPTVPTIPTESGPNTPSTNDDFPDVDAGEIVNVKIPTPFYVSALIQDK